MVHSSLAVEPSGAPLSNHARRYQAPSQASASSASRSRAARSTQRLANSKSLRSRARTWKRLSASYRKNPSQTLSPRPPSPTPIGRAHLLTPVPTAPFFSLLFLLKEKKKTERKKNRQTLSQNDALRSGRRAQRRTVVEPRAPVPGAVPGFGVQCFAQPRGAFDAAFGEQQVAAVACQDVEAVECLVQEESKPDALAASALPHPVHAVVPVAGADQRQAALAEPVQRTLQDRKSTRLNSSH